MDLLGFIQSIDMISVIFFAVGFILVVVEMFHPGFGAPGIIGGILLVLGIIFTARTLLEALILLIVIIAVLGAALTFVLQSATKGRLSKTLILSNSQRKDNGYIGTEDLNYFLDKEGVAYTVLRPAGIADFSGVKMDVVSDGDYIQKGTKVRVAKVEGRKIVVKVSEYNFKEV